jgi:general stress protein 26
MTEHGAPAAGDDARRLWDMIREMRVAMLTTRDDDGTLRSRPMAAMQAEFDGTLWFFTKASSHKAFEVRAEDQVCLSYAEADDNEYVSVSGRARLVRDPAKARELWNDYLKTWFPGGVDDPDLALLRVDVEHGEYWDGPSSAMVRAYMAAERAAGHEPRMPEAENAKVELGGRL